MHRFLTAWMEAGTPNPCIVQGSTILSKYSLHAPTKDFNFCAESQQIFNIKCLKFYSRVEVHVTHPKFYCSASLSHAGNFFLLAILPPNCLFLTFVVITQSVLHGPKIKITNSEHKLYFRIASCLLSCCDFSVECLKINLSFFTKLFIFLLVFLYSQSFQLSI